ncbi:pseudouridine synthase [Candidatus Bathyarchaeota archaeon]|nr:pseudouridine synthase [Candidatus Bathyarchaeota archaeon]
MFIVVESRFVGQRCQGLENPLRRIRSVADYQFGKGVGEKLFPENVEVKYSKRTGRVRYIYLNGKRLATLRPMDGLFSLSIEGAKRIVENNIPAKCIVTVKNDVSKVIADGDDVFAVHVVKADSEIRPKDEVIVVSEKGDVLAVGRAVLSGWEMTAFKIGVAVKVRHGSSEES